MWRHRLTERDVENRTATCSECGPVTIRRKGVTKKGTTKWRCANSGNERAATPRVRPHRKPYSRSKKDHCEGEGCTTTIVHPSQLDVHHVDGDKTNNHESNLQTLCACCHRLVHFTA